MYFTPKHERLTRNIDCPKCSFSFTVSPPPDLPFLLCPCCGAIVESENTLEINSHSQHPQPNSPQHSQHLQPSQQQQQQSTKPPEEMITIKNCIAQPNYSLLSRKLILNTVVSLQVMIFLIGTFVVGVLVGEWCKQPVGAMVALNTEVKNDKPETKFIAVSTEHNNSDTINVTENFSHAIEEVVIPIEPSSIVNNTDSSNYDYDVPEQHSPFALARPLSPVTNQYNPFEPQIIPQDTETSISPLPLEQLPPAQALPLQTMQVSPDVFANSDDTNDVPENNIVTSGDYQSRLQAAEKMFEESRDSL
ncbi:MAG: hypothetical protein LBU65_09140, partial [Planctomycetaceae bacterium]|nr:hypothetical protein [Planctomycetaceae bacterium]